MSSKSISQLIDEWRKLDEQSVGGCPHAEEKLQDVRVKLSKQGYDPSKLSRIAWVPRDEYLRSKGRV